MRETIAVWFSCGAASAVAAYLTIQKYKDTHDILIFNTPVQEEDKDNIRFRGDEQIDGHDAIRKTMLKAAQSNHDTCFEPPEHSFGRAALLAFASRHGDVVASDQFEFAQGFKQVDPCL